MIEFLSFRPDEKGMRIGYADVRVTNENNPNLNAIHRNFCVFKKGEDNIWVKVASFKNRDSDSFQPTFEFCHEDTNKSFLAKVAKVVKENLNSCVENPEAAEVNEDLPF